MTTNPRNLFSAVAAAVGVVLGASAALAASVGGQNGAILSVLLWGALLAGLLSLLLSVFAVRPWFNSVDDGGLGPGVLLLGALAVAVPSFIAAALIARHPEEKTLDPEE